MVRIFRDRCMATSDLLPRILISLVLGTDAVATILFASANALGAVASLLIGLASWAWLALSGIRAPNMRAQLTLRSGQVPGCPSPIESLPRGACGISFCRRSLLTLSGQ